MLCDYRMRFQRWDFQVLMPCESKDGCPQWRCSNNLTQSYCVVGNSGPDCSWPCPTNGAVVAVRWGGVQRKRWRAQFAGFSDVRVSPRVNALVCMHAGTAHSVTLFRRGWMQWYTSVACWAEDLPTFCRWDRVKWWFAMAGPVGSALMGWSEWAWVVQGWIKVLSLVEVSEAVHLAELTYCRLVLH